MVSLGDQGNYFVAIFAQWSSMTIAITDPQLAIIIRRQ